MLENNRLVVKGRWDMKGTPTKGLLRTYQCKNTVVLGEMEFLNILGQQA
jgi:hypothetical protein